MHPRLLVISLLVFGFVSTSVRSVAAQAAVSGTVVDQLGGAIAGATVTVRSRSASDSRSATTDNDGRFTVPAVAPGRYDVEVTHGSFDISRTAVEVADSPSRPLTVVLNVAGFAASTVVTGRRTESRLVDAPQRLEVVTARDIERTVAADLTDVLKKNSGVDVVQYTGALSGIGIRGFRPETSGANKRSLLLVDGRPSGVTNLSTLLLDNVERIEVLKGPASAIYGASAMGGVVNVITRESRGPIKGGARLAFGSFDTTELSALAGGSLGSRLDFDLTATTLNQRDDLRMGNGVERPATSYQAHNGSVRLGWDVSSNWRVDGHLHVYRGRDINTPGDVVNGVSSQGRKDLERTSGDIRLAWEYRRHLVSMTMHATDEAGHTSNVTTSNPLDTPYLPYLTFESDLGWRGAQVKDAWSWGSSSSLVYGVDYERVTSHSTSHARTGARQAPFSADSEKETVAAYAENTFNLANGRTIVSIGGRLDRIAVSTVDTPLKSNFTPSTTTFAIFNPSVGVKHHVGGGVRAHGTAGRAFVPADAGALTGFTTTIVGGRTQINRGNPDLRPERSASVDAGIEWRTSRSFADVTYFYTDVSDRVVSNVLVASPPPPDPIVLTVVNALGARISGLELDVEHTVRGGITAFTNATHYFSRTEELPNTGERDILNVAKSTIRAGIDVAVRRVSTRLAARYVRGRQDQDFNLPGSPVVHYSNFVVADVSALYRLATHHAVLFSVNNLFDAYYFEKKGYPLAGASVSIRYRLGS